MRGLRAIIVSVVILLAFCLIAPSTPAVSQGNEDESSNTKLWSQLSEIYQQKKSLTPAQRKVDWNLLQTVRQVEERVSATGRGESLTYQNLSTAVLNIDDEGMIEVKLAVADLTDERIEQLEALGMNIRLTLPKYGVVEGKLPYYRVEAVAGLDFVTHVDTPGYGIHNTGDVTSAGDTLLRAFDARQAFGVDGGGAKVGVMSDGVSHLSDSVPSGDLPSSPAVQVLQAGTGDEGTAMLEIIHDLAPGASLAFYAPTSSSDMVSGISALETAGCNIIVDDLTFFDEPKFEDGPIAQEARRFCNDGGVYVTSAGNQAQRHYRNAYNRDGEVTFDSRTYYGHNHASNGPVDIENNFNMPNGTGIIVVLQWNNPWGQAADDFDLLLASDSTILDHSVNVQDGIGGDDYPWERVSYTNNTGSSITAAIVVLEDSLVSAPSSLVLDYTVYRCPSPLEYHTAENSVLGHAAVAEVLSVAAASAAPPYTIEGYSSRGPGTVYFPTYEERQVPNITGVDGVQTKTGQLGHFPNPFYGTSASAPHVAAIAALVWEANPTLTSSQVFDAITSTAIDLLQPGWDIHSGFGRADAHDAVASVLAGNTPPVAYIDSIAPDPATQGVDTVYFEGHGTDVDGTVVAWLWTSSIDGQLSTSSSFDKLATELSPGAHTIRFQVQDDDGARSTEVTEDLTINPLSPTTSYSPSSLSFTGTEEGPNPPNQTLGIWNSGSGTLSWSVSDNAAWLSLFPTSGTSTGEMDYVNVSVNISRMAAGSYSATITISAPGATNTPQTVPVSLAIAINEPGELRLEGDVNGDGVSDAADALLIAKHIVGTMALTGDDLLAADVTDDDPAEADAADLLWVQKKIVDATTDFPGGTYIP